MVKWLKNIHGINKEEVWLSTEKKPVEIEAFQYDGDFMNKDGYYYVPDWAVCANAEGVLYFEDGELFIKTLEGIHHASVGDYIIRGVKQGNCENRGEGIDLFFCEVNYVKRI